MSDELTGQNVHIAVLGGTGFVGQHLVQIGLAQSQPAALRLLVHRSRPNWMQGIGDIRDVNLDDPRSLSAALDGCQVLINLLRPSGDGWLAATLGRMLPTIAAQVRTLIHASSIDVYGAAPESAVIEATLPKPLSPYAREHLQAERLIAAAGVQSSILRLGAVFGIGGRNLIAMADSIARESAWKLAARRAVNGKRRFHLVAVETVAEALFLFARRQSPAQTGLTLVTEDADDDNNFAFVQQRFAKAFGRNVPVVGTFPRFAVRAVLAASGRDAGTSCRRFSNTKLEQLGFKTSVAFSDRIDRYASHLAAEYRQPGA